MATLHSDFLLGNDTTGDGSALLPYKTIVKSLQMAVDGDLVKVAGGQFVTTGATGTCTARGTTIATSVDLTSQFAIGDLVAVDTSAVDGYPLQANIFQIGSISSTTITLRSGLTTHMVGTFDLYKISTVHYTTTLSSVTLETATAITANQVTVEGGWDSTFTTQFGWTVVNRNASGYSTSANFMSWNALIKPEIVFNKFLFCNIQGWTGSASSIGINELALSWSGSSASPFGTSNFGVYAPTSIGWTTIYSNGYVLNNSWNGSANKPTTLQLKQWVTNDSLKGGYALSEGQLAGPSIRTLEGHWRSCGTSTNVNLVYPIGSAVSFGDVYVDDLTMWIGGQAIFPVFGSLGTTNAWRWVGDLKVNVIDGTRSGITSFRSNLNTSSIGIVAPWNLNLTSYEFEQLPWLTYGSAPGSRAVANAQSAIIYGRDVSGNQKVIDGEGIVRWADTTEFVTGSNSLRTKLLTNTAGVDTIRYYVGHFAKPSATFTVTIKMKASKAITIGNSSSKLELQYGPSFATYVDVTPSTTSLGTSWTDVTFTLDPSTLSMWDMGDDGLVQMIIPVNTAQVTDPNEVVYLWVDSVTVA